MVRDRRPESSRYVWLDGEILPWEQAQISVTAVGSLATVATVFEGVRAYWNVDRPALFAFRLPDHLKRFLNSMKLVRMEPPFKEEELYEAILELVRRNGFREDSYIFPKAFFDPIGVWGFVEDPSRVRVVIESWPRRSRLASEEAIHCCVSSWTRISDNVLPPRIKCVANYQNSRLAAWEAHLNGYDNSIMLDSRGKVTEGPGMCLFIVRNGVAITPPVTSSILESITRQTILELLMHELTIDSVEREVDRTELYIAEEAFFCGTGAGEVTPIASIDRYKLGLGKIGPITDSVRKLYHDVVRGMTPSYEKWLTEI